MNKIEYKVDIDESGFLYCEPSDSFENTSEDKLLIMELARYYLYQVTQSINDDELSEETINNFDITLSTIDLIYQEMSENIKGMYEISGETDLILPKQKFNLIVKDKNELYDLRDDNILYEDKIFKRCEGLKILVSNIDTIFELKNNKWVKLN